MSTEQVNHYKTLLHGNTRLLRRSRRLRAAVALARDASVRAIDILLEVIMSGGDNEAVNAAATALSQHADWRHINIIASVWALTRHPTLGRLISQHGWIANAPPDARVLSALHIGQLELLVSARPGLLPALIIATGDRNQSIAQRARRTLLALQRSDTRQALCMLAIEQQIPIALEIARRAGYVPDDMMWRAVYLLLTDQREAFRACDPECQHIVKALAVSSQQLRERIARALYDEPNAPPIMPPSLVYVADLNDAQWQEAVQFLSTPLNHHVAAVVARYAPARWAAKLLVNLDEGAEPASRSQTMPLGVLRSIAETCLAGKEPLPLKRFTLEAGSRGIHHLALSHSGDYLAAADGNGGVFVWHLNNGIPMPTPQAHPWPVRSLIFSRNEQYLCSAASVGPMQIWDLHSHRLHHQFEGRMPIQLIPDSDTFLSSGEEAFHFWSLRGTHLSSIRTPAARVAKIALSPDGQYYAVAGSAPALALANQSAPRDHGISIWRLPSGELLAGDALSRWLDRGDPITRLDLPAVAEEVVFSPNSQLIAAVCGDGYVRIWRLLDGMQQQIYPGTTPIVFLQDGDHLLSGSASGGFQIRQTYTSDIVANVPLPHGITSVMTSVPTRGIVVGGSMDGTITMWRLHESLEAIELKGHEHRISALTISADGQMLVSADITGAIIVWDIAVCDLIRRIPLHVRPSDRTWISDVLKQRRYKGDERRWLEFMNALYRTPPGNRRGYDPSIPVDVGSFRLRLE